MNSAATASASIFPRRKEWRPVLAETDPDSSSLFEGRIAFPISAGATGIPVAGHVIGLQTENVTFQLSSAKLDAGGIGLFGWDPFVPASTLAEDDQREPLPPMIRLTEPGIMTVIALQHIGTAHIPELLQEAEVAPWLDALTSRIFQFSALPQNWDSYGSKRISNEAIRKGVKIANLLSQIVSQTRVPLNSRPFVAPSNSGGVLFEVKAGNRQLHIDVPNGREQNYGVLRIWRDAGGNELERESDVRESELREVLTWIAGNS